MPIDLVLIRHGESEGNVAVAAGKHGDDSLIETPGFRERHSSWWRLTDRGVEQAQLAGAWVRERVGEAFDRYYASPYVRAVETAAHLGLPDARWYLDPRLRERQRGQEELLTVAERAVLTASRQERASAPMYWRPLNGESIADTCIRIRDVLDSLHRTVPGGSAVITCHGEVMESFCVVLQRLTVQQYAAWTESDEPFDRIHNGQVMHFTRRDPVGGTVAPTVRWWRSAAPGVAGLEDPPWLPMSPSSFGNEEMLAMAEDTPRLIDG